MGGIGDEAPLLVVRALEPTEHPVHGRGEAGDFVAAGRVRDPPVQLGSGDLVDLVADRLDRRQRPPHHPPGRGGDHQQQHGQPHRQQAADGPGRLADRVHDARDQDGEPALWGVGGGGDGQEVVVVVDRHPDLYGFAGPQASDRWQSLHVGAGGDHLAVLVEDLDEQVFGVTDRQPAWGGARLKDRRHLRGTQPRRGLHLAGERVPQHHHQHHRTHGHGHADDHGSRHRAAQPDRTRPCPQRGGPGPPPVSHHRPPTGSRRRGSSGSCRDRTASRPPIAPPAWPTDPGGEHQPPARPAAPGRLDAAAPGAGRPLRRRTAW